MSAVSRLVWRAWEPIAERAARSYIAGPELRDGLHKSLALGQQGVATTICPWDGPGDSPRQVADWYLAALRAINGTALDCYLSVKAPSLKFSRELLAEILETAGQGGIRIHFDSLALDDADRTWRLIHYAAARHPHVGCTLPARWRRSSSDLVQARELGLSVRVVKGQWADSESSEPETREHFLALVEQLTGHASPVAVATHDPSLAREALTTLRRVGTRCELELLFGLPMRSQLQVARTLGVPVRVYIPYGHAWLPYGLSQVRQNPRIVWWTARDWLLGWGRRSTDESRGALARRGTGD
jgi:proline dehydrogenase